MDLVAIILCAVLCVIGFTHLIWAFGLTWPCADEATLAKTVIGRRGIEKMPPRWASLLVAICLFAAAYLAIGLRNLAPVHIPTPLAFIGGLGAAAVFGLRGAAGVMPTFEKLAPEQPFLSLNRRYYSPLCVIIGLAFAVLSVAVPNWTMRLFG